ncbi:MAG: MOSC domain-containing protein [Myxococcales bacterium]|nr:MOSC domain-containing protein [Myxococcales bacterium]
MQVASLHVYPVKSLGGVTLTEARLAETGLQFDRRMMLVDDAGRFYTQREHPGLARVAVSLSVSGLTLTAPGGDVLAVSHDTEGLARREVTVWGDTVDAAVMGADARRWMRTALGLSGDLVAFDGGSHRAVDAHYAAPDDRVGFADGFALLVTTEASLDDLNGRLDAPVGMARFRPNVVLSGATAWAEDDWQTLTVAGLVLRVLKPCGRCVMVDIDPERAQGRGAVLKTLATFRMRGHRVVFGQNVQHHPGDVGRVLRVGDLVVPQG